MVLAVDAVRALVLFSWSVLSRQCRCRNHMSVMIALPRQIFFRGLCLVSLQTVAVLASM